MMRDKLGVVVHQGPSSVLTPLINLGFRNFRITAQWFLVETDRGIYEWTWLDKVIAQCRLFKCQMMLSLEGPPAWLMGFNSKQPLTYMMPEWVPAWKAYVDAISERYRGPDVTFAVSTEINLPKQWSITVDSYIEYVIKPASEVLKPKGCRLVGGSPTMQGERQDTWDRAMTAVQALMADAGDYIDALDVHIYRQTGEQTVSDYKRFANEYNRLRIGRDWGPVYLSETGFDETFGFWGKLLIFLSNTLGFTTIKYSGEQAQADKFPPVLDYLENDTAFEKVFIYHSNGSPSGLLDDSSARGMKVKKAGELIGRSLNGATVVTTPDNKW